jgi:hypothetical protein
MQASWRKPKKPISARRLKFSRDFFRLPKGILDLTIDGLDVDVNEDEYPEDELPPGSECSP